MGHGYSLSKQKADGPKQSKGPCRAVSCRPGTSSTAAYPDENQPPDTLAHASASLAGCLRVLRACAAHGPCTLDARSLSYNMKMFLRNDVPFNSLFKKIRCSFNRGTMAVPVPEEKRMKREKEEGDDATAKKLFRV